MCSTNHDERRKGRHQALRRSFFRAGGARQSAHGCVGRRRHCFLTLVAPLLAGWSLSLYVLVRSREPSPPAPPCAVSSRSTEQLRPWSMIEVFVFGVFVAYVKLGDIVTIGLSTGVYALMALTVVLVWMDSALDREALWERLDQRAMPETRLFARRTGRLRSLWSRQHCTSRSRAALSALRQHLAHAQTQQRSRGPGPWSSPPRSSTSRPTTTRC